VTNNQNVVIFDLDGCVSDDAWRLPKIGPEGSENRYDEYHSLLSEDEPLPIGKDILKAHINNGDFIVFCTARPGFSGTAEKTKNWLYEHFGLLYGKYKLLMRPVEDNSTSPELKKRMVAAMIAALHPGYKVTAAYDDRIDVLGAYLELNLGIETSLLDAVRCTKYKGGPAISAVSTLFDGLLGSPIKPPESVLTASAFSDDVRNSPLGKRRTAADVLADAAKTFAERNAVYKDNAVNVGNVMQALFPNGVQLKTEADHHLYHLFELIIVKLTRFANSNLTHVDSIHDSMVYAAMVEVLADKHNINNHKGNKA
jgi:hypothetical protein